ncbi:hypothetical protein [Flavobacterium hydrophilum]|uniref:Uncharacterized protein n=1 Tax=Flavobacterium hydrophilum TaxID=2211445 RepID=A0A2V4C946_9FLAO|nr:hypothetical protein [Flavobacterium hydrophilum]PXY46500.1 hypothetical protein DMB68_04820 [Flavobacterium hydrophilum]
MKAIVVKKFLISIFENQILRIGKKLKCQSQNQILKLILKFHQLERKYNLIERVKMILNISSYIIKIIAIYDFFKH